MNRKTWSLGISAVMCLFAANVGAAEPGFYVTASLGKGDENPKTNGINIANIAGIVHVEPDQFLVDDGDVAWSVGLGYRINKYVAGEVEYLDFGTTHVTEHYTLDLPGAPAPFPFPSEFTSEYSSHVTGPALSLLGTLPVGENFELFLRGGALFTSRGFDFGSGSQVQKYADTVWLVGAGASWSFAKRWAIRAEFQQTDKLSEPLVSGETQLKRISLSVLFKL